MAQNIRKDAMKNGDNAIKNDNEVRNGDDAERNEDDAVRNDASLNNKGITDASGV